MPFNNGLSPSFNFSHIYCSSIGNFPLCLWGSSTLNYVCAKNIANSYCYDVYSKHKSITKNMYVLIIHKVVVMSLLLFCESDTVFQ